MSYIKAITYYQPEKIVSNADFEAMGLAVDSQMLKTMGVESRAWATDTETSGDLAIAAAKKMFQEHNISPEDIDFLIFCSQGMDYFMPSTSCIIQDKLGIPTTAGAFGFDLGCSGFVYGLAIADSFIESGLAKNVLLLTADTPSKYINHEDKNILLFGDAASATLVSASGIARIGKFDVGTDGSGYQDIIIKNGSWRNHYLTGEQSIDSTGAVHRDDFFFMDGEAVFNFTAERIPLLISECMKKNSMEINEVDYFVFHQANRYMLNTLRKLNNIPKEKFFVDLTDTGNTASSTVPIGIVKSLDSNAIQQGAKVMVAGFGVGLSWAGTVLYF